MQKLCNKVIAIMLVAILLGFNSITTCVYAADAIATSQENVTFNAVIGNSDANAGYEYLADIDSQDTTLYLSINVKNTGYLKDISVNLEGNNYKVDTNKVQNERIKNIEGSVVSLNQVNAGEGVNLALPIYLEKGDKILQDEISKESKVKLLATYVNENNKEKKIEKEITNKLTWYANEENLSGYTNQNVIRYLNYNGKTMVSLLLSDSLKDYKLPVSEKEIVISSPVVKNTKPSKVIVTAIGTANTNGKLDGTDFNENNFSYNQETGLVKINVQNIPDDQGNISWHKGVDDKFIITYIYDINTNEEAITINSQAASKMTLVNGKEVTSKSEKTEYELDAKIGDIATVEVNSNTQTLNKGYMYSNKDRIENKLETQYTQDYKIHVGLAEALDKITLSEVGSYLGEEDATNYIYNKKVSINKEELIKVLGEDGKVNVIKDGKVLGTLNKDTLELEVDSSKLIFETTKPKAEGDITLTLNKVIKDLEYTKEQIKGFETLTTKVQINQVAENVIKLEEPTSKAKIELSNNNLSTVVKNENVIITATLERDDITDSLYKDPEVYIKLPEEVKKIDIKDAKLLYDEELVSESSVLEGNTIKLKLKGTQTEYSSKSTSNGSVIRIVSDLTLDNLASSKGSEVLLGYKNTNNYTEDVKVEVAEVNIVAPTGFVTTNSISGYNGDEVVTSQEGNEGTGKLPVLSNEKELTISGTIVNNLGTDANGFKVLGRIPFKGNKQVDGSIDLGSTFDTKMVSAINVEGIDSKVYYSENGNATKDLENSENGWSENYTENAKSYLIVANNTVVSSSAIRFNYKVKVPANIEYSNSVKSSYGVYYNNDAREGNGQNVVLATPVGVKTDSVPEMNIQVTAKDMFTGNEIQDRGAIKEGQYLTYTFTIKNTSKEDALNSRLFIQIPGGLEVVKVLDTDPIFFKDYSSIYKELHEENLGTIKAGETKVFTLNLLETANVNKGNEEANNLVLRASLKADNMPNDPVAVFNTKLETGYISATLRSTYEDNLVPEGKEIDYALTMRNVNFDEKTNVVAKIKLPEGIEYVSTIADEASGSSEIKYEGSYDKKAREVTFNIGNLAGASWETVYIRTKVASSANEELKASATVSCSETQDIFSTNQPIIYTGEPKLQAKLSSNIEGNLLDTDTLEYYIDVTNTGTIPTTVNIHNALPSELANKSYKLDIAGTTTINKNDYKGSKVSESAELKKGETARLTVVTKPHSLASGEVAKITNEPQVKYLDENSGEMKEIEVNSLTHTIEGTGDLDNPKDGLFRISGTAWLDANKNGKKEEDETKLAGIEVTLYTNAGNIAKDTNGDELIQTTDSNGRYNFMNLNAGDYVVVAKYDTQNYIVTTYKAEGLAESENSDFFDTKLENVNVAATDTITITNSNSYNIDLGLKEKEKFDLRLDKLVNKVTVTNTKLDPRVYEFNKQFVQVSLYNTYVEYSTVLIEYTINVTNDGKVAGYAKEIVDYIPEGMAFSSELNSNWYLGKDGNAYTTSLANTIINPGETKTVKLVLTRKMTGENVGMVHNVAEIFKDYNEYGLSDGNSTPGNKKDGENDMSYADTLLAMSTGREVASFIGITLGVLAIVVLAVYLIRKYIITKI